MPHMSELGKQVVLALYDVRIHPGRGVSACEVAVVLVEEGWSFEDQLYARFAAGVGSELSTRDPLVDGTLTKAAGPVSWRLRHV